MMSMTVSLTFYFELQLHGNKFNVMLEFMQKYHASCHVFSLLNFHFIKLMVRNIT